MLLHSKGEGEPGCPAPRRCHPRLTDCSPERPGHSENRWRRGGHRDHNPGRPPGWKGTTHPPERPGTGLPHTGSLLGFPRTGPSSPGPTPERTRFGCQQRARFLAELPSSAARTGGPRPPPRTGTAALLPALPLTDAGARGQLPTAAAADPIPPTHGAAPVRHTCRGPAGPAGPLCSLTCGGRTPQRRHGEQKREQGGQRRPPARCGRRGHHEACHPLHGTARHAAARRQVIAAPRVPSAG